jgi:uncharacterized MAPEG superfamily protein
MDLWHTPSFAIYSLFATGLCLFVMSIDGLGGGFRAKSKTTPNVEDASTVAKGAKVVETDPEQVARVMRAHRNAFANIIPFLLVMFFYVAVGASTQWVLILCGAYSALRVIHAIAYINGKQPFRTLSFVLSQTVTVVAAIQVVRIAISMV